jgi:hypothetical protein
VAVAAAVAQVQLMELAASAVPELLLFVILMDIRQQPPQQDRQT